MGSGTEMEGEACAIAHTQGNEKRLPYTHSIVRINKVCRKPLGERVKITGTTGSYELGSNGSLVFLIIYPDAV